MKKHIFLIITLLCMSLLTACGSAEIAWDKTHNDNNPAVQDPSSGENSPSANTADPGRIIEPLPSALDINALDNCSVSAGFTAKDIYLEDYSRLVIHMTVYDAECFLAEAVAGMEQGDFIVINGDTVEINSVRCDEYGTVVINESIELSLSDSGNYTVTENGVQVCCPIGEVTIPVAQEFLFRDCSDISQGEQIIYPGDMITEISGGDRVFTPDTTTVTISDGKISGMSVIALG